MHNTYNTQSNITVLKQFDLKKFLTEKFLYLSLTCLKLSLEIFPPKVICAPEKGTDAYDSQSSNGNCNIYRKRIIKTVCLFNCLCNIIENYSRKIALNR